MCIYGMEGPGGYAAVRPHHSGLRTAGARRAVFEPGHPWLLRFFDKIRFFPVDADELLDARAAFPHGQYDIKIEQERVLLRRLARGR